MQKTQISLKHIMKYFQNILLLLFFYQLENRLGEQRYKSNTLHWATDIRHDVSCYNICWSWNNIFKCTYCTNSTKTYQSECKSLAFLFHLHFSIIPDYYSLYNLIPWPKDIFQWLMKQVYNCMWIALNKWLVLCLLVQFFDSLFSDTANFSQPSCRHTPTIQCHGLRICWKITSTD